jgi:signal transduction histidine kinase
MTGDVRASPGPRWQARRGNWTSSIRTRVLMIVLIPSLALLGTGASVAGYLISEGLSARDFASAFVQSSGSIVESTSELEQERTISLRALGGDRQALAGLRAQWTKTNAALGQLIKAAEAAHSLSPTPNAVASGNAGLQEMVNELAGMRQSVLDGRAGASEVNAFYTRFANGGSLGFLQSALSAPGTVAAVDELTALDLYPIPDLHSQVVGLGAGWAERGVLTQPERLDLAQLTGAYRDQLQTLLPRLAQPEQAAYARLAAGAAWRLAMSGEDDLALRGKLAGPVSDWLAAENTVSAGLLGIWGDDLRYAQSASVTAANHSLSRSVTAGSLVLLLAVAAFAVAIVMANGLVRRLRRLREETLEMADVTLPSMVQRIGDGEAVDVDSEVVLSGYGSDEIGQVAEAFKTAQRTAVALAAAEARTRGGVNKVFLDIAHRSQLVVHRQLELLDVAEAKQSDPEHLEMLFQLDHLATRARRNAENLLILGGGQPGRKWRRAAGLEDIVRSAVSETEHFARVSTVRLPQVQVHGAVVGDLIHLLAELVDNATAFSPPGAAVTVRGHVVGKGVVVEVEDQGLGIEHPQRERLNETLANPPGFQAMALSGQRHLGLFVVGQLAQRHGIAVSLLDSAYGGTRAIVLVPAGVMQSEGGAGAASEILRPGRHEQREDLAGAQPGPVPWQHGREDAHLRQRQVAGPSSVDSVPPSSARPDLGSAASRVPSETPHGPDFVKGRRSRAALPHRERMANLAPGLRPAEEPADSARPRRPHSPQEASNSMSAFQRGTRLGRDSTGPENR